MSISIPISINFDKYSDAVRSSINNINHEDCNQPASQQNEGFSKE